MAHHPLQGPPAPDAIPLGRFCDWDTGLIGNRLRWNESEGVLLFGPMGSGKDTRLIDQLLLQTSLSSIVVLDVKGESAAKTAAYRRTLGPVHIINPTGMLVDHPGYRDPNTGVFHDYKDLASGGFNPLLGIDGSPDNPHLVGEAQILADSLIEQPVERDKNSYFSEGAANIWAVAIVLELLLAKQQERPPSMARTRAMVCQPSGVDENKQPYGWAKIAQDLSARAPIPALRNLVGQLRHFQSDIRGMHSEAMGQTKRLDDPLFARDMEGWTFDVNDIKRQPTTVYIMIPEVAPVFRTG